MSYWSLRIAVVFAVLAALGPALAWLGWLPPLFGFGLFSVAVLVGGPVSLIAGLIGMWRSRGTARSALPPAVAALLGLVLLTIGALSARSGAGAPAIHDVTTTPERPPAFEVLDDVEANTGRDMSYPHGDPLTPTLQREHYPELDPIALSRSPERAYEDALAVAEELGWTVVDRRPESWRFEAFDETSIFRFVDDVVVEVEPSDAPGGGSIVHVRSTSRVGRSDLGANAERIRRFEDRLRGAG